MKKVYILKVAKVKDLKTISRLLIISIALGIAASELCDSKEEAE